MPPEVPPSEEQARPRVSVVVPAFNCEPALRRCVSAIEASTDRQSIEVLVVDAGSSDGCPRIDIDFPGVTVLRLPRNFGRTRACNIGMRTAQADLVLFLDPRVEVAPGAIAALTAALESRGDATAAAPVLLDPAGRRIESAARLPSAADLAAAALQGISLPASQVVGEAVEAVDDAALMVRKNFVAGMNYLDEKRFSEYWSLLEVCWQIRNAGKKLLLLESAQATLHPGREILIGETPYAADRVAGAAAYLAKHHGLMAGISFRLKCLFSALGAFRLPLACAILVGRRIDPTQ